MEKEVLIIKKGGKLISNYWDGDDQKYKQKNVTNKAILKTHDVCVLDKDVTLEDIFLLLNTELDIFDTILGNWCKEFVLEGLKPAINRTKNIVSKYDPDEIEYLELRWNFSYDGGSKYGPEFYGYHFPDFHGVGFKLKKDKMAGWKNKDGTDAVEWPKGERIPWSVSFTPVNELKHLPLKLNETVKVFSDDVKSKKFHEVINTYKGASYTLYHILYGVIWELSFNGAPQKRNKMRSEIDTMLKDIKLNEK